MPTMPYILQPVSVFGPGPSPAFPRATQGWPVRAAPAPASTPSATASDVPSRSRRASTSSDTSRSNPTTTSPGFDTAPGTAPAFGVATEPIAEASSSSHSDGESGQTDQKPVPASKVSRRTTSTAHTTSSSSGKSSSRASRGTLSLRLHGGDGGHKCEQRGPAVEYVPAQDVVSRETSVPKTVGVTCFFLL